MKEVQVNICITGATEDEVNEALVDLCEAKGWQMGGGIRWHMEDDSELEKSANEKKQS